MLDLAFFRSHFDQVTERLATRGGSLPLDGFRELDRKRRTAITEAEQLKAHKNAESKKIGQLKSSGADTTELQASIRVLGDRISELDKIVETVDQEFQLLLAGLPNIPHESVPVRRSEAIMWSPPPRHAGPIRLRAEGPLGSGTGTRHPRLRTAPPNSPARASPCTGAWARNSSVRSSIFSWTRTRASTATPKCCRRSW
jgi:hypothetical protein